MKRSKKILIGGVAATLIVIIGGFALVSANGPWAGGGRFNCRFGGAHHMGFRGEDMADFVLWRMDRQVKDLNLTDLQKEKYNLWKTDIASHLSNGLEDRRQFMTRVQTELAKPEPDIQLLVGQLKAKIDEMSGFADQNLDRFVDLWLTLDKDQQQQVLDHIRERLADHQR